jgi:hypothetical protein
MLNCGGGAFGSWGELAGGCFGLAAGGRMTLLYTIAPATTIAVRVIVDSTLRQW